MVSIWLAQQPPPEHAHASAAAWGYLTLALILWVGYKCLRAQIRPLNRCQDCPKPDAEGNNKRCKVCGGRPEVLNKWAYAQMLVGIPVPRARRLKVKHPRAVPEDW